MNRGGYFPGAAARPTNDEMVTGWDWKVRVAGRPVVRRVTLEGVSLPHQAPASDRSADMLQPRHVRRPSRSLPGT